MMKLLVKLFAWIAIAFALSLPALADDASGAATHGPLPELHVITREISPFVIKDGDDFKGFSIKL